MNLSLCLFAVCLAGTLLSAQTSEVTTKDAPVTFKSGVNLVPVPVVVRDSKGRAVGDLTIDDFQLFDNGKPQMISKFSIEKLAEQDRADAIAQTAPMSETAAPGSGEIPVAANSAGIPDRFVAYLFDDLHMSISDLVHTREAARRQIDSAPHARERVAIFTMSGQQMQEFTSDRDKLHKALDAIGPGHASSTKMMLDSLCPPITYYMGDRIINKHDADLTNLVGFDYQMKCETPALSAPRLPLTMTEIQMVQMAARQAVLAGDNDSEMSLDTLRLVVGRLSAMPGKRSIVLISPGFLVLDERTNEETAIIDRAVRANIVIGALDARGLYSETGLPDASEGHINAATIAQKATYATAEAVQQSDVMAVVAYGTGGTFFQNSNDFDKGIESTAAAPDYLYVLGFSPLDLKLDGKFHSLKVTLKNRKGLDLQVRTGYYAPKHAADPAEQAKQEIEEAFFSRDEVHDLPATLLTQYFKAANGEVTLSAIAKIDVKSLKFRKNADRNSNDITVVAGLFDNDGNYISGEQKVVEMRLLDETLAKRLASGIAVKNSFTVRPGRYMVRLVVRDSEGQTMATQSSLVEIP